MPSGQYEIQHLRHELQCLLWFLEISLIRSLQYLEYPEITMDCLWQCWTPLPLYSIRHGCNDYATIFNCRRILCFDICHILTYLVDCWQHHLILHDTQIWHSQWQTVQQQQKVCSQMHLRIPILRLLWHRKLPIINAKSAMTLSVQVRLPRAASVKMVYVAKNAYRPFSKNAWRLRNTFHHVAITDNYSTAVFQRSFDCCHLR